MKVEGGQFITSTFVHNIILQGVRNRIRINQWL